MTTQEQLEKLIKKKFGSRASFCRQVGVDEYEVKKLFQRRVLDKDAKNKFKSLLAFAKEKNFRHDPKNITEEDRLELKEAIKALGGITKFIEANPRFKYSMITKLLGGRVNRLTKLTKELLYATGVWKRATVEFDDTLLTTPDSIDLI